MLKKNCDRLQITRKASEEKSSVIPHSFFAIHVSLCFRVLFTVFVTIRVDSTTNSKNLTGISVRLVPVRQRFIQTTRQRFQFSAQPSYLYQHFTRLR